MVASNFFGRSKSFAIINIAGDLFSKPSSKFVFVKENTATSAPEIKAEQVSKIIIMIILEINEALAINKDEIKTVGSGSKIK